MITREPFKAQPAFTIVHVTLFLKLYVKEYHEKEKLKLFGYPLTKKM